MNLFGLKYGLEKVWKKNFDYSRYFKTRETKDRRELSKKNEIVQKNWKLTGRKANFQPLHDLNLFDLKYGLEKVWKKNFDYSPNIL